MSPEHFVRSVRPNARCVHQDDIVLVPDTEKPFLIYEKGRRGVRKVWGRGKTREAAWKDARDRMAAWAHVMEPDGGDEL